MNVTFFSPGGDKSMIGFRVVVRAWPRGVMPEDDQHAGHAPTRPALEPPPLRFNIIIS
jgi:hypothetical protein